MPSTIEDPERPRRDLSPGEYLSRAQRFFADGAPETALGVLAPLVHEYPRTQGIEDVPVLDTRFELFKGTWPYPHDHWNHARAAELYADCLLAAGSGEGVQQQAFELYQGAVVSCRRSYFDYSTGEIYRPHTSPSDAYEGMARSLGVERKALLLEYAPYDFRKDEAYKEVRNAAAGASRMCRKDREYQRRVLDNWFTSDRLRRLTPASGLTRDFTRAERHLHEEEVRLLLDHSNYRLAVAERSRDEFPTITRPIDLQRTVEDVLIDVNEFIEARPHYREDSLADALRLQERLALSLATWHGARSAEYHDRLKSGEDSGQPVD